MPATWRVALLSLGAALVASAGLRSAEPYPPKVIRFGLVDRMGGSDRSESAVAAGLDWVARHQAEDGHWSLGAFPADAHCNCTGPGTANNTAGTAFGLLPLLGAGMTHRDWASPYAKHVERGLAYLRKRQTAAGDFGDGMYAQGLATMALCDAYALTGDPDLKGPAQRAVDYLVDAQHEAGGWRYVPKSPGDTSVTAWQVQALVRADLAGLRVPPTVFTRAGQFLDSCAGPEGGYGYTGPQATPSMTAAGLLCRQYLGWGSHPSRLTAGIALLEQVPPGTTRSRYEEYYATAVMYHAGGRAWQGWNGRMRDLLINSQDTGNDPNHRHQKGSWSPSGDAFGQAGGRLMITSLSLLTLEVYYREDLLLAARPERELKADDLPRLWGDLASDDVLRARRAVWALVKAPGSAVALAKQHLHPAAGAVDRGRLAQALKELDDDNFNVREKATEDLEKAGELAEPLLRDALKGKPSPEARRRIEASLEKLDDASYAPDWQRERRALEVLEWVGTPAARDVLAAVAKGTPEARLTREAKACLQRLAVP
jgi:hypothetical protein